MPNSQRIGFSRIIHLTLLLMLLTAACGRDEEPADESIKSRAVMSDPLTCVVSSADSTSLLLGSEGPSFSIFDIRSETSSNYALPPFTRGWKTYDILQLSPTEYLIAKRNLGVIYARYGTGVPGINRPEHIARVKFPPNLCPTRAPITVSIQSFRLIPQFFWAALTVLPILMPGACSNCVPILWHLPVLRRRWRICGSQNCNFPRSQCFCRATRC